MVPTERLASQLTTSAVDKSDLIDRGTLPSCVEQTDSRTENDLFKLRRYSIKTKKR
jgi:hypothetical protein